MDKNILIVDDHKFNRRIIRDALNNKLPDIKVYEAENGYKALQIMEETEIMVVVLDIMMPEIDGIETLRRIKKNPAQEDISVIMYSALDDIENIELALGMGALDYFTKPLTEEQMNITLPLKVRNAFTYYKQNSQIKKLYRHMKEEIELAEQIQKSLVLEYDECAMAKMWGKYIPCESIGGDIYCFKQVNENLWFLMADVSGHGVSAAMVATMVNVFFKTGITFCSTPGEMLSYINNRIFEAFRGTKCGLMSAFAGFIQGETLYFSNAGHPYPIIYDSDRQTIDPLRMNGFLLGLIKDAEYETDRVVFNKDDILLVYTDGLFENEENYSQWDQVLKYCECQYKNMESDMEQFLEDMVGCFNNNHDLDFLDDVAVMAIKRK